MKDNFNFHRLKISLCAIIWENLGKIVQRKNSQGSKRSNF